MSAVNGLGVNVGVPTAGTYGHLALFSDGHYGYVADNSAALAVAPTGSHLHDIFNYTASDGHGGTSSAALDITLNRGPDANADVAGVSKGGRVSGNVLANDFDSDGDAIALAGLNGGTLGQQLHGNYGWLTLYADGRYSYQSDGSARLPSHGIAQDRFTYAVTDDHGGTSTANLTVTTAANGQTYLSGTPNQTISAGNGKDIVDGTLGGQTLAGGNGADVLLGGPGDVLSGGNGPDQFVFQNDFGHNEITDFSKPDVIVLQASTFGSIANILAHYAVNDGHGNVLISDPHDAANTITVDDISLSQLNANSFLLI